MAGIDIMAKLCTEMYSSMFEDNGRAVEDIEISDFNKSLIRSNYVDKYPRTSTPFSDDGHSGTAVPEQSSYARRLLSSQKPRKHQNTTPKLGYESLRFTGTTSKPKKANPPNFEYLNKIVKPRNEHLKNLQKKYGTNESVQEEMRLQRAMKKEELDLKPSTSTAFVNARFDMRDIKPVKLELIPLLVSDPQTCKNALDKSTTLETMDVSHISPSDSEIPGRASKRGHPSSKKSWFSPKKARTEVMDTTLMFRGWRTKTEIQWVCMQEHIKFCIGTQTEAEFKDSDDEYDEDDERSMPDGKAPHFPQQPVARQNDDGSLELECFVDANPTPQVKWYYDNKEVENSGRFSANLANKGSDSYSAILTIKELADADAGAYRCAIVNPHGKGNANFNLKLTGFSSPTFVEKPQISSRDDGQVMVMEFRAKSILEPTFVWQKLVGGGAEEIIANSDRIKAVKKLEAGNVYYSALEIKEPTKDKDAGQFICTVKNESGKLTATFTVKFEVPEGAPSFTRKPQILQQTSSGGEPAICFDIGYSARMNPQVTWISPKSKKMKESSRIKFKTNDEGNGNFTAQLELTNYKAKDSGTYTCNIKNDAGEANVELTLNIEGPLDDYADDSEN